MSALTPPDLAKRYGVSPDKVLAWIRAGELPALNVATKLGGKPRYIITPEGVAAFEARRSVTFRPSQKRSRRNRADVVEFF